MTNGPVLAVLPLGATEQHGPHLPVETDTLLATATAEALVADPTTDHATDPATDHAGDVVLLPAIAFGASGEHQTFPPTASLGTDALATVVVELGRSVGTWADRLLVVNGHGGNVDALGRAVPLLRHEGRDAAWLACRTAEHPADTHAGHAETSLMLHLHPSRVRSDLAAPGCTRPLAEILPELRAGGVAAVSPTGVLGDPTTATAAEGRRLWNLLCRDARARLERWAPAPRDGRLQ